MKTSSFRTILVTAACFSLLSRAFAAAPDGWTEGFTDEVRAKAEKEKQCMLLFFTGSDWCPACQTMAKDVLSSEDFRNFAQKTLLTVWLDFPRNVKQKPALRKANEQLLDRMLGETASFPVTILLDQKGKILGRINGSMPVKVYLTCLRELMNLPPAFQAVRENRKDDLEKVLQGKAPILVTPTTRTPILLFAITEKAPAEIVKTVLQAPVNVNQGDINGMTPLLAATDIAREEVMDLLLKAKADPNRADRRGITPLALAIRNSDLKKVRKLAAAGANVNKPILGGKMLPIHLAVRTGDREVVRFLLEKRADPNRADSEGNTALHYAAALNDAGMISILLRAKANPAVRNKEEKTPADLTSDEQIKALLPAPSSGK